MAFSLLIPQTTCVPSIILLHSGASRKTEILAIFHHKLYTLSTVQKSLTTFALQQSLKSLRYAKVKCWCVCFPPSMSGFQVSYVHAPQTHQPAWL